jgi:hypothetical protein
MTARGVYVSTEEDVVVSARKYTTSELHAEIITATVVRMQCFVRRCLARRLVGRKRAEKRSRQVALAAKETRRKKLAEGQKGREIDARLHPKTSKDFEILYNGLESMCLLLIW